MTDFSADLFGDESSSGASNNNAGNIRAPDGSFQSYDTPQAGVDAMRNDLIAKVSGNSAAMKANYGDNYQPTLRNVISTWAPPTENDTEGYINYVAKNSGIKPDQVLTTDDVSKIMPHMITMEHGSQGAKQYADAGNVATDAQVDKTSGRDLSAELFGGGSQQPQSIIDKLKNPPDTSFVSNYGQGFLDTANRARLGIEGLGQAVGKTLYGANPQDAAEEASRKAALTQLDTEKAQSGVQPSGFGGVAGNIAGSIAGSPASWLPMGEISGIGDLARAGAIQGGATGLIQNTDKTSLGSNLANAAIGAGEGAAGAAALGKAGQTVAEIPGGIANRVKGAFGVDAPEDIAAQSEKNWQDSSDLFKSSTTNGAVIHDASAQGILNRVKSDVGILGSRTTGTAGVLEDFQKTIDNGNVTPEKLHDLRQDLNDVISKDTKSKIDGGGIGKDGQKAMAAKNALDESMIGLGQKDLSAGTPQAIADLQNGINSTARAYRYDRVASMLKDANGDPNAIMRGAIKLQKNMKGLNDDETAALSDLATRGTGQTIERALGVFGFNPSKLYGNVVPAITAGSSMVIPGGVPLTVAGTIAGQTGKWAARGKGQNLLDTIMERDTNPSTEPTIASQIYKIQQRVKNATPVAQNPYSFTQSGKGKIPASTNKGTPLKGLMGKEPEKPEIQDPYHFSFAKGGLAKNRAIHLTKTLEVKLGRKPKDGEIELAHYVGAHGVHRLLKTKDGKLPAHKMFPADTVKGKRELFFNKKTPYTVEQIRAVLG